MKVTIDIHSAQSVIAERLPRPVVTEIHRDTSYETPDAYFAGLLPHQSRVYLFNDRMQRFPTGLLGRVLRVLERFSIQVQLKDHRQTKWVPDAQVLSQLQQFDRTLRWYQAEGLASGIANPYGLFWWPTGAGKTTMFSVLILCYDMPTLILTHRRELMYQLQRELQAMTGYEVGLVGDGNWQPRRWTVGIVNSFMTKDEVERKAEVRSYLESVQYLIIDECHHLGAKSWWKIAHACVNTRARHGFSGTCFRTDNADLHLLANTGGVISHFTTSEMIEDGWLARPHIYMPPVGAPVCRSEDWRVIEKEVIAGNHARNISGCQFIYDRYNHGDQVLVMVRLVPHGRAIRDLLQHEFGVTKRDVRYMSGSKATGTRERALQDFKAGKFSILIGTSIYNEGIDLPLVGSGVNFAGGKGDVATTQRLGRTIRKKPDPELGDVNPEIEQVVHYLDFDDVGNKITNSQSRKRKRVYQSEPAFRLYGEYYEQAQGVA